MVVVTNMLNQEQLYPVPDILKQSAGFVIDRYFALRNTLIQRGTDPDEASELAAKLSPAWTIEDD